VLTVRFQKVPSTNANEAVSGVRCEVSNTGTVVSDIRRNMSKGPKDARCQDQVVGTICILPFAE